MLEQLITKIIEETVKTTLKQLAIGKQEHEIEMTTMNTKQVAKYLNMSVPWVYQNLNLLKHSKIGKKLIFSKKDIDRFLEQQKEERESNKKQNKASATKVKSSKYKVV